MSFNQLLIGLELTKSDSRLGPVSSGLSWGPALSRDQAMVSLERADIGHCFFRIESPSQFFLVFEPDMEVQGSPILLQSTITAYVATVYRWLKVHRSR
jgi:hypothetical protein